MATAHEPTDIPVGEHSTSHGLAPARSQDQTEIVVPISVPVSLGMSVPAILARAGGLRGRDSRSPAPAFSG